MQSVIELNLLNYINFTVNRNYIKVRNKITFQREMKKICMSVVRCLCQSNTTFSQTQLDKEGLNTAQNVLEPRQLTNKTPDNKN